MRLVLFAALLRALPLLAAPAPTALPPDLAAALRATVDDPALATGFAGTIVVAAGRRSEADVTAGRLGLVPYDGGRRPELFATHADRVFTPASGLKTVTCAATLDKLGPDYRFVTRVAAPSRPADGLVGTLYLIGGGDPGLTRDDLGELAAAVAAAGVKRVAGGVRADETRYRGRFGYGWAIDDLPWYYGPEISALSLGRNLVSVTVKPGTVGGPAQVTLVPASPAVPIVGEVRTTAAGTGSAVEFDRDPDSPALQLGGTISIDAKDGFSERMAVPRPARWAAATLIELLRAKGVVVEGSAEIAPAPAGAVELARRQSKPLGELMSWLLKYSDNLYAEIFLRELGRATGGDGSAASGARAVEAYLDGHDIAHDGLRMADGSGLSRYNLISPRTLAGVLRQAAFSRHAEVFFGALPIAGVDGTLSRRMAGTAAERRVNAKTGYISNHTSLSGYVTTRGGDVLIVSTIWNHFTSPTAESRRCHDQFFASLAAWTR